MFLKLRRNIKGFAKQETGSLAVEAVIIVPILFWAITAMFTFFHAYKNQSAAFRANYTVSDILSRETGQIDMAYLRGLHNVYQFMTLAQTSGTWLRISVVECKNKCDDATRDLNIVWSNATGGARSLVDEDFSLWESKVPWLPRGDQLILLETSSVYEPPFQSIVGNFTTRNLESHSVTRPRFAPQLLWEGMANGDDSKAKNDKKSDNSNGAPGG